MFKLQSCRITLRERRGVDLEYLSEFYTLLRKNGLYVYDVTQSLIALSEYNLIVGKEIKTC